MRATMRTPRLIVILGFLFLPFSALFPPSAWPQFDSGSTGADGEFHPTANVEVDLSQKPDGIFNYTTITIPAGVTVTFRNNAANTLVTWLASGDVAISGTVNLNGATGSGAGIQIYSTPGPGGYAGGFGGTAGAGASNGFGPGGGRICLSYGGGAGHATPGESYGSSGNGGPAYGNIYLLPLQGGSGGAGGAYRSSYPEGSGGGAGGGALLLAASGKISISGAIYASGGSSITSASGGGGGSGGSIRLVSNEIGGNGTLRALGGTVVMDGAKGRIRREAFVHSFTGSSDPSSYLDAPGLLWLPSTAPSIRITSIAGTSVPANPTASLASPDVTINQPSQAQVNIAAKNVPVGTTAQLSVIPALNGTVATVTSTPLAGTLANSTATAQVVFPIGVSQIFVSAQFTPPEGLGQAALVKVISSSTSAPATVQYFNADGHLIAELPAEDQ